MLCKQRSQISAFGRRTTLLLLASSLLVLPCPQLHAATQENTQPFAYDVASIKVNKSGSGNVNVDSTRTSYTASNVSLEDLIEGTYGIRHDLIFGGPAWMRSARFDVLAKIVDPDLAALKALTPEQDRLLLQPILADRFHLKVHTESRTLAVYELVLAKGGPKFRSSTDTSGAGEGTSIRNAVLTAHAIPLSSLASTLSNQLHQTVIDRTGLGGRFDINLTWISPYAPDASPESSASSIFTAVREQLGLKLQSAKGPVEVLVVDRAEMPSEN